MVAEIVNPKTGEPRVGIRRVQAIRSIVAAATTTLLHEITPGRTAVLRKVMWSNRNPASGYLQIGSTDSATGGVGGTFTRRLPEIFMGANLSGVITEDELPAYEFRSLVDVTTDIVARSTVAAASPDDIEVLVETEEFEL